MKHIVTGGAGFIGSHLTKALIDRGDEVSIIDNLSSGAEPHIHPDATFYQCDIRNLDNIDSAFKDVDTVFHLAALARVQPSIVDPETFHDVNVTGTFDLLQKCVQHNVRKFIFSSSSSVYGDPDTMPMVETMKVDPLSPYACNKLIGENYCALFSKVYNLDTVCLRYFNVYGDNMALAGQYRLVLGIFAEQWLKGQPLTITGDGYQKRDFTHVDDVVSANILAADSDISGGEVFNVGNGDNRTIRDIAQLIKKEPSNWLFIPSVLEPSETLADNSKLRRELDWKPSCAIEDWLPGWLSNLRHNQSGCATYQ